MSKFFVSLVLSVFLLFTTSVHAEEVQHSEQSKQVVEQILEENKETVYANYWVANLLYLQWYYFETEFTTLWQMLEQGVDPNGEGPESEQFKKAARDVFLRIFVLLQISERVENSSAYDFHLDHLFLQEGNLDFYGKEDWFLTEIIQKRKEKTESLIVQMIPTVNSYSGVDRGEYRSRLENSMSHFQVLAELFNAQ